MVQCVYQQHHLGRRHHGRCLLCFSCTNINNFYYLYCLGQNNKLISLSSVVGVLVALLQPTEAVVLNFNISR